MFDLHRSFVSQQLAFTRDALEAQQEMLQSADAGVETWRALSEQQAELARSGTESALDQLPEEFEGSAEFEAFVSESIEQFENANEMGIDASEQAFDDARDAYSTFVETYLNALETGVDAYLEATENVEQATESVAEEIDVE